MVTISKNNSKKNVDISNLIYNEQLGGKNNKKTINKKITNNKYYNNDYEFGSDSDYDKEDNDELDNELDDDIDNIDDEQDDNIEQDIEQDDDEPDDEDNYSEKSEKEYNPDEENDNKNYIDDEETLKDKCYSKYAKINYDDIDFDEMFGEENILVGKNIRVSKPILSKYEFVRLLTDRTKQLAQGAKHMLKNTQELSSKEIAKLEIKEGVIPLIIERPIPNSKSERWKISELEVPEHYFSM